MTTYHFDPSNDKVPPMYHTMRSQTWHAAKFVGAEKAHVMYNGATYRAREPSNPEVLKLYPHMRWALPTGKYVRIDGYKYDGSYLMTVVPTAFLIDMGAEKPTFIKGTEVQHHAHINAKTVEARFKEVEMLFLAGMLDDDSSNKTFELR